MFRSLTVIAVFSAASLAAAQAAVDSQVQPDTLRQVQNFESVLVSAVNQAATRVTDRALQAVPDFKLRLEANPFSKGFVMPSGEGMFFLVEVPGIEATSELLWSQMRQLLQQQQQQQPNPNMPRVGNPVNDPLPMMTNPGREYSDYTRQAVIEAMLDAITLPLKEGQNLTVSVGSTPDPSNPMATLKRLYLILKAEDLIALRAKTVTRDEVKAKIVEKRY